MFALVDDISSSAPQNNMETGSSTNGLGVPRHSLAVENSCQTIPSTLEVKKVTHLILDIILEYALNKFDDSKERLAVGAAKFLSVINRFVVAGTQVETCLPAFPFKSANKVYKVLGNLPDKAEELALERLNSMCARIRDIYPPGAKVTIISDGTTYNDLLSISDRDTWAYGEALRDMSVQKGFDFIGFSRMKDLLDFLPEKLREITYVANCTNFRRILLNKYGNPDLDIDHEIATNPDTKLTYLGYQRFLQSDLKHIFTLGENRSSHAYKKDVKFLAKQMLIRGYAFAGAVKNAFPNHLRLSIHESIGEHKVSMSLLNTKTGFTTPWHCSVALLADGEWVSAPMGDFKEDPRLELVYENGQPSYFKEKSLGTNTPSISETSASYLKAPKRPSRHASGASTPIEHSSSIVSNGEVAMKMSSNLITNGTTSIPYGRRLIPQVMDSLASADPGRTVFSLATFSNHSLEFSRISAQEFTRAVDKTAWWLHNQVGKPTSIQPVGYIGPHDLRYVLLTYACVKAGYAALFLSPNNNTEEAIAVINAVECKIWVKADEVMNVPLVQDVLQQHTMKVLNLPELNDLLDAESIESFSYTKTYEEATNDPFCFLPSSGTTGVPKPISWSHCLVGKMDPGRLLPLTEGDDGSTLWTHDWKEGDRIYSSSPMSHSAGIIMNILMPAFFNLHCILGPVEVLPDINLVDSLAEHEKIDIWSMVPSLVDGLGETPDVLSKLKPSKVICVSDSPISTASAGKVNDVVKVLNWTGTTEGQIIGNLVLPKED